MFQIRAMSWMNLFFFVAKQLLKFLHDNQVPICIQIVAWATHEKEKLWRESAVSGRSARVAWWESRHSRGQFGRWLKMMKGCQWPIIVLIKSQTCLTAGNCRSSSLVSGGPLAARCAPDYHGSYFVFLSRFASSHPQNPLFRPAFDFYFHQSTRAHRHPQWKIFYLCIDAAMVYYGGGGPNAYICARHRAAVRVNSH